MKFLFVGCEKIGGRLIIFMFFLLKFGGFMGVKIILLVVLFFFGLVDCLLYFICINL